MRFRNKNEVSDDDKLDLTPLLDVSFIILIFFILTTTFIENNELRIEKPNAKTQSQGLKDPMKIIINSKNKIYIENSLMEEKVLKEKLEQRLAANPNISLIIQADKNSNLSTFVFVFDTAKTVGIQEISISTKRE